MAIHCAAAERGGVIKKDRKKEKKESSLVKLKTSKIARRKRAKSSITQPLYLVSISLKLCTVFKRMTPEVL